MQSVLIVLGLLAFSIFSTNFNFFAFVQIVLKVLVVSKFFIFLFFRIFILYFKVSWFLPFVLLVLCLSFDFFDYSFYLLPNFKYFSDLFPPIQSYSAHILQF